MKRSLLFLWLCPFIACTSDLEESVPSNSEIDEITMTVKDFESDNKESRMSVDVSSSGAVFKWSENDTVGIFPNEGGQVYFPMTNGAGSNQASFTGGGWALKPSSKYSAYYPFNFYNRDLKKIEVNYEGQTQKGDGSTAHLGAYDYMAAVATTPTSGKVNFDFQHLGCLVELNVTLPKVSTYKSITLSCDEAVFTKRGTIDLSQLAPLIMPIEPKSSHLTVKLESLTTTQENEAVKVFLMVPPMNLTGKTLNISVDNNGISEDLGAVTINKKWLPGRYYQVLIESVWVDLGLPSGLLWATKNIGALCPEDCGDSFAWGNIVPKSAKMDQNTITQGMIMGNISGNKEYDAATAYWGGNWRTPKIIEFRELIDLCTWEWTSHNGIKGMRITGPNGNNIFLPETKDVMGNKVFGNYWSSDPQMMGGSKDGYNAYNACSLGFQEDGTYWWDEVSKKYGHRIRPVMNNEKKIKNKWIDLGLPSGLKWASLNVGATSPEEYGDYFAWGETAPKVNYSKETYLHGHNDANGKYQYDELTNISGNVNYDAAKANWGGSARMPTTAEYKELLDSNNSTIRWTTRNGVYGLSIISKRNGNNIFLPSAGYRSQTSLQYDIDRGLYWNSDQDTSYKWNAYIFRFISQGKLYDNACSYDSRGYVHYRYEGLPVRPVCD